MIEKVEIKNFTVFEDITIDTNYNVNIFIGENGTGKTHLLKLLMGHCDDRATLGRNTTRLLSGDAKDANFGVYLTELMRSSSSVLKLATSGILKTQTEIELLDDGSLRIDESSGDEKSIPYFFIPAKDMLTHGRLEKDFMYRELPFNLYLIDVLNKVGVSVLRHLDKDLQKLVEKISKIIGGKVVYKSDQYFIDSFELGRLVHFNVVAEGHKKFALLYRLIETGYIKNGSVLLWDEPEANINPKLIPDLVEILLELSRSGVQIFIATHDYFLPKYFEVLSNKTDTIAFHALYKTEENGVKCETEDKFSLLSHNHIKSEIVHLYEAEIEKGWREDEQD
ncbi:MAG: AAA family ATPase [Defluviitaleaceae bacterium]|nr:AAA family ATPase [Defluviitaleaceae bacterium]